MAERAPGQIPMDEPQDHEEPSPKEIANNAANLAAARERLDTFLVDDWVLVRRVRPKRGKPYEHSCLKKVFEDVAWAIEEMGGTTFNLDSLRERVDAPCTQVAVALAFLKERGCVEPARRRMSRAAEGYCHLDAMIEYHALREGSPGSITI